MNNEKKNKRNVYICQVCEHEVAKWTGKCSSCEQWNSLIHKSEYHNKITKDDIALYCAKSHKESELRYLTTSHKMNKFLGGGIVKGSLYLLTGEPGVGKSTFMLSLIDWLPDKKVLYISGEETKDQISSRIKRCSIKHENLYIYHETNWRNIENAFRKVQPDFIIIDSIQTLRSSDENNRTGSITELKDCSDKLIEYVKKENIPCMATGHVNKEGTLAGPKLLEHMVDVVFKLQRGEERDNIVLSAIKNRHGNVSDEVEFSMTENGLDISSDEHKDIEYTFSHGEVLCPLMVKNKVEIVEVKSLVIENFSGNIKRIAEGIEHKRFMLLIAIIEKYCDISFRNYDIYLSVDKLKSRSNKLDLAVISSILSSYYKKNNEELALFCGEVDLSGKVKKIKIESELENKIKNIFMNKLICNSLENDMNEVPRERITRIEQIAEFFK